MLSQSSSYLLNKSDIRHSPVLHSFKLVCIIEIVNFTKFFSTVLNSNIPCCHLTSKLDLWLFRYQLSYLMNTSKNHHSICRIQQRKHIKKNLSLFSTLPTHFLHDYYYHPLIFWFQSSLHKTTDYLSVTVCSYYFNFYCVMRYITLFYYRSILIKQHLLSVMKILVLFIIGISTYFVLNISNS